MPTCRYCGDEFEDEDAYLSHLQDVHDDELGRVDRRRVEAAAGDNAPSELRRGAQIAVPVLLVLAVAGILYAVLGTGGGSPNDTAAATEPSDLWSVHYHGTIEMRVLGDRVDFSQSAYQLQADAFHFENDNGVRWHVHARDVTLGWALASLDIEVTEASVTFQDTTYEDSDPAYNVSVTVNGEEVDPETYVLQDGDEVRVIVTNASN